MTLFPVSERRECRLNELEPGSRCVVRGVDGAHTTVRRLMELGLVPGTPMVLVRQAPLGDPYEIQIRGVHLSIRRSEAEQVYVEPL